MRKLLYLLLLSLFLSTSCTLETSDNGDLDGFWQLSLIDTLSSQNSVDMRDSGYFWAVQHNLLILRETNLRNEYICKFKHMGDSLIINNPYYYWRDSSDIKLKDPERIRKFGVNNLEEKFKIVNLNSSKMVLESQLLRLYFRKY